MARLYADEDFPLEVVEVLRRAGHDVLTAFEAGRANRSIPDAEVLVFATGQQRAVLTLYRWHFVALHAANPAHAGLVVCSPDRDVEGQGRRIDEALRPRADWAGTLLRINRPPR